MAVRYEARVPGTPLGVRQLRREMTAVAKGCGMDAERIAYAKTEGELRVTAATRGGELAIVIADTGPGLVERRDSPGLGVGLAVIANVVERLRIVSHPGKTEIHMAFPCPNSD